MTSFYHVYLDGCDGSLFRHESDKRAALALALGIAQHRALLDRAVASEQGADVVLRQLLV